MIERKAATLLAVLGLAVAACSGGGAATTAPSAAAPSAAAASAAASAAAPASAAASASAAGGKVKVGFITKFPVDFYDTMVDAVKTCNKDHPDVEVLFAQGASGTDDAGEIAAIESFI